MTNGTRVAQAKHLESSAAAAKRFLLSKVLDVTEAVSSELENLSGMTIDTSQPTVDGALWYAHTNGELQLRLHYGDHDYSFDGVNAYDGGFYTLTFTGGSTETCCSDIVLNAADYPDVTQIISSDGGTIIGGGSATSIGGANVSLVGSANAERFLYTGGNVTISGYGSNDYVQLSGNMGVSDAVHPEDDIILTVSDNSDVVGSVIVQGVNSFQFIQNGAYKTITYTPPSHIDFDTTVTSYASRATVNTTFADFGVQENDSPQGAEIYSCLQYITCTKDNSTIIGNAKPNSITICGGENNSLIGGIGTDQYYFASGGGTIGDFGLSKTTKNYLNKYLATTTKRTGTSTYVAYDRTDHDSYQRGGDTLQVNGTVTAVAVPYYSADGSVTQALAHFDATVYYVDEFNKTHSILLANVLKYPNKFDKNGVNYNYKTHNDTTYGAPALVIQDMSTGEMAGINTVDFIYDPEA